MRSIGIGRVTALGALGLALGLGGCLPDEGSGGSGGSGGAGGGGPQSCAEDFECPVGEICEAGTGGGTGGAAEGTCVTAGAGDERTFGRVTLDFAGDLNERHLLIVYSVPTEDEVSTDVPIVTLVASEGALPPPLPGPPPLGTLAPSPLTETMKQRLLDERARREQIDRLIEDIRAGRRSILPTAGRALAICDPPCDDTEMCFDDGGGPACVTSATLTLLDGTTQATFDLDAVLTSPDDATLKVNVLVDQAGGAGTGDPQLAVEQFLSTLALQLQILGEPGHAGPLDRNGDGRMTVAFSDAIGAQNAGVFVAGDYLPASDNEATGNEMDILWARLPVLSEEAHTTGTLAHEYTHLVSFARRVYDRPAAPALEKLWLDEGLAHTMEDLTGWGGSNITTVLEALDNWNQSGFAILPDQGDFDQEVRMRGQAMLFLRYLIDREGATDAASSSTLSAAGTLYSGLIEDPEFGFGHPAFQDLPTERVGDWLQAVYTTGNPDVTETEAHANDYLALAEPHPLTPNTSGIDTHAEYTSSQGDLIALTGPVLESLVDISMDPQAPLEPSLLESGAVFYELTDFTAGVISITGTADASLDLRLRLVRVQ